MVKDKQVRVKDDTLRLVRMFAGQLQLKTGGENVSDDVAIYEIIRECKPDLLRQLEEIQGVIRRKKLGE